MAAAAICAYTSNRLMGKCLHVLLEGRERRNGLLGIRTCLMLQERVHAAKAVT